MGMDENGVEVTAYTHGRSSTKTGEGAYAYMAVNPEGRIVDMGGDVLSFATPLEADLGAMEMALKKLQEMGYRSVCVMTDSPMAENVVNRKVKAQAFHVGSALQKVQQAVAQFDFVIFGRAEKRPGILEKMREQEESTGEVEGEAE